MIEVIDAGFFTTLQDEGRKGYRHLGVPLSGPMDPKAYQLALALLPCEEDFTLIECTLIGPTLRLHKAVRFVLTGGTIEAYLDEKPLEMFRVYNAQQGSLLRLGKVKKGIRAYVRFQAELSLKKYLGSTSFFSPITPANKMQKGEKIPFKAAPVLDRNPVHMRYDASYINSKELAVLPGPDWDKLSQKDQEKLMCETYPVMGQNRMGYRLKGNFTIDSKALLSQLVLPGRVQLTPSGELLIATADCQVTGGYLQILQLTAEALASLVQKREGEALTFRNILD